MTKRSLAIIAVSLFSLQLPPSAKGGPSNPPQPGAAIALTTRSLPTPKVEVLVVGTIHQRHGSNPNYSYADIVNILSTFNPDLICVEIRPQDFRKVSYLKEMMLATIWGLAHGKNVVPVDWWDENENARKVRDKLAKQPEYVEKDKQEKALYAQSPIVSRYEKKYGPADAENNWGKNFGYEFWNGADYNGFYAEVYRISMQVYGDSPFNLYYETRNGRMMDLIRKAIHDRHGRRVIVLAGSEHKHFFDREFRKDPDVLDIEFASLLPLKKPELEPAIRKFLDEDDDSPYYEKGYPVDPDASFREKLVPLVHGPDMDVFPDTIQAVNIERAEKVLQRWAATRPENDRLAHERAWLDFLRRDYGGAVRIYVALAAKIDGGQITDPWLRFDTYLNLGRCYDLLGERKKALDCYARSEEIITGTRWEKAKAYIFQNYRTVPFKRAKAG